jgi:putative aldouronate transport system permease protein
MEKTAKQFNWRSRLRSVTNQYQLYLFIMPTMIYFIVFKYIPMYGVQIAFKDFITNIGIWKSPWIGFVHFERLFQSVEFVRILKNTFLLSGMQLAFGFPLPIIVAIMLNQVSNRSFKKFTQTTIYAPYFISTVVLVGMITVFSAQRTGLFNLIITAFGGKEIFFMGRPGWFRPLYVMSSIWQNTGWSAIIYIAALTSISNELYEAAVVDGASKWQKIIYIEIPGLMPTAVIMLILSVGNIMSIGFEKAYLMQNGLNRTASEIISTYVYKQGLLGAQFSFSSAVGLFNSVTNLVLLFTANTFARKIGGTSLW